MASGLDDGLLFPSFTRALFTSEYASIPGERRDKHAGIEH